MGRINEKGSTLKWCRLIASCAFLTVVIAQGSHAKTSANTVGKEPGDRKTVYTEPELCEEKYGPQQRSVMLVSTLDGKVSALNLDDKGTLAWSISTGEGDLLDSSISKLEVNKNGVITRLIPSLDGGLYSFDGESVESMLFNADTLLSHSFRFNDDSTIVGGKSSHTYGIDLQTGKIRYACSSEGCDQAQGTPENPDHDEVLLVTRNTKIVRAVEMRTGAEKWNFSVGEHEVSYISHSKRAGLHPNTLTDESRSNLEHDEEDHWLDEEKDEEEEEEDPMYAKDDEDLETSREERRNRRPNRSREDESREEDLKREDLKREDSREEDSRRKDSREGDLKREDSREEDLRREDLRNEEDVIIEEDIPEDDEDVTVNEKNYWEDDTEGEDVYRGRLRRQDIELKVIVPSGMVIAVARNDPTKILWKYKFATPIANAWTLQDGVLESMDLFDAKHVPALSYEHDQDGSELLPPCPALYVGLHQKQIYVQPSVQTLHAFDATLSAALRKGHRLHLGMPKVSWKPYLASAPSRTPVAIELQHPVQITWDSDPKQSYDETGLSLWHAEYPYDPGYYLYYERAAHLPLPEKGGGGGGGQQEEESYYPDPDTLLNWWKEVMMISVVFSILIHYVLVHLFYRNAKPKLELSGTNAEGEPEPKPEEEEIVYGEEVTVAEIVVAEPKPVEYESRYLADFEQITCLGKGGFGVVYHARNQLDDCDYAVKRIVLRNSESARVKVGREVKALAKLDHAGIVRYYNAWFESPPPGWQEKKDEEMLADLELGSHLESAEDPATISGFTSKLEEEGTCTNTSPSKTNDLLNYKPSTFNPLKPFGDFSCGFDADAGTRVGVGGDATDESSDWADSYKFGGGEDKDLLGETQDLHKASSFGFHPRNQSTDNWSMEESGSYSGETEEDMSRGFVPKQAEDDSFGIEFKDDTEESEQTEDGSIPFDKYSNSGRKSSKSKRDNANNTNDISCDIIFEEVEGQNEEDSGCHKTDSSAESESPPTAPHSTTDILSTSPPNRPTTLDVIPEAEDKDKYDNQLSPASSNSTPAIPKLYLYIQMQLCQKESLKDWLAANTLNRGREKALDIFFQIVSAVDYVHEFGLMHRDLKPSNIFFSMDGTVKIGDFGLATEDCRTEGVTPMNSKPRSHKPHTNQVGTKLYMSPEQNAGKQYTNKVDIYALGLILFELSYPFATMMERGRVMQQVKRLDLPARFRKELTEECELVEKLLSHKPELRPTTTDILDTPMMVTVHQKRLEHRRRTNSRNRTLSTMSSHSDSTGQDEESSTINKSASGASLSLSVLAMAI